MLVPAPIYPIWRIVIPAGYTDPAALWIGVGLCLATPALLSYRFPFFARHLERFRYACLWLITIHLFWLASLNGMYPLYAVGSVIAILGTAMTVPTRSAIASYAALVFCLTVVSYILEPDLRKIAYWGSLSFVLGFMYYRITAQLVAEQQMERLHSHLQDTVRERTKELSAVNAQLRREIEEKHALEERLRLSQKMEAASRLAGGIAHEFNNLLTVILGYGGFVLKKIPKNHVARKDAEQIVESSQRAADLTAQLLAFSRQDMVRLRPMDVSLVLKDLTPLLQSIVGEAAEVIVEPGEDLPWVCADHGQLEQIVVNLALNARDAMPNGGTFRVTTRAIAFEDLPEDIEMDRTASGVLLSICDSGHGMDPETKERVFDPFFTTKEIGKGTGLGLSIVYNIVQSWRGKIAVKSSPSEGSRFDLYLPAVSGEQDVAVPERSGQHARGGGETILVVEDSEELRNLLGRTLESAGYQVFRAQDGQSALEVLGEHAGSIHLIVSDVVMPNMTGLELAENVVEHWPTTPVLLISGQLSHPTLNQRPLPACITFLEKPFDGATLCSRVREVLNGDASEPAA